MQAGLVICSDSMNLVLQPYRLGVEALFIPGCAKRGESPELLAAQGIYTAFRL